MHLRTKKMLFVALLLAMGSPAAAQTADELFDNSVLHEIRLTLNPSDWAQLKAHFTESTYYPADMSWRGIVVEKIGIRSRGTGSASGIKPYLGLDFKQYVKNQRFQGLASLRLKNAWQDPSFLHERLSMLLFRRMGMPAPREAYARLYVNDQYAGLYEMMEEIDESFLQRVFGEDTGYLYNYQWSDEYHFEFLGEDPALYAPAKFDPKTRKSDYDPATIVEMVRTINQSPDDTFVRQVSEFLDLKLFLKHLAIDNFLAEWDGVLGYAGMNNFYLYRFDGTKRFQFIPWDKSETLKNPGHSIWYNLDSNVLTSRILKYPEFSAAYQEALRMTALEAGGTGGWLEQELERAYSQMRAAALEDSLKPVTNEEFENSVEAARGFVRSRRDFVISQVGPAPPPAILSGGVVNGANFARQPLAVGSIASIFGTNLAFTDMAANLVPLPTTMDRTTVRLNGIAVPLFSIGPSQINFQVPWELAGQSQASLTVTVDGVASTPETVHLTALAPALFSVSQTGSGQGAILIASTSEVAAPSGSIKSCAARPVARGEFISIYGTGLGPVTNQPASEAVVAGDSLSITTTAPVVTIGGVPALVTFSGLAPSSTGLYQVNAQLPENTPTGDTVPLVLTIGGIDSNPVTLAIQ